MNSSPPWNQTGDRQVVITATNSVVKPKVRGAALAQHTCLRGLCTTKRHEKAVHNRFRGCKVRASKNALQRYPLSECLAICTFVAIASDEASIGELCPKRARHKELEWDLSQRHTREGVIGPRTEPLANGGFAGPRPGEEVEHLPIPTKGCATVHQGRDVAHHPR